jgi:hypothetical protein
MARALLKRVAMQRSGSARFAFWGLVATLAVGGVALVADALVESDEERLSDVADSLVGPSAERRIDALLAWVDTARVPVTVRADGVTERFGEDDPDPADAIRDALAPLRADSLELVQQSVSVEGEHARLALRVRSDGAIVDAQVELARDGQAWLVREVRRLD